MGKLTTHVLNTTTGQPAYGVAWICYFVEPERCRIATGQTNRYGRTDSPILEASDLKVGTYELIFMVGDYFRLEGLTLPKPSFLEEVVLRFGIAAATEHYHVPLLVSPYGYSTYRGS